MVFASVSLGLMLGVAVVHGVLGVSAAQTSAGKDELVWESCDKFGVERPLPGLYCAHAEVPMDYHNGSAGTAILAVIKYTASGPGKSKGSVFVKPGGPGSAGTFMLPILGKYLSAHFDDQYDIVSWDPRGSVSSYTFPGSVTCFGSLEEEVAFWQGTPILGINVTVASKFTGKEVEDFYATLEHTKMKMSMYAQRCSRGPGGPYLQYIGTSSTVRDLAALGDKIIGPGQPINYWGLSYGTVIGFHFINMFPDRVGRFILDGVCDPSVWGRIEVLHTLLTNSEAVFLGFSNTCASAGRAGCKLLTLMRDSGTGEEVKRFIEDSYDLALKVLLTKPDKAIVDPGKMKILMIVTLYVPGIWTGIANEVLYPLIYNIHQSARAANITTGVADLPHEEVRVNIKLLEKVLQQPPLSHSITAIYAADSWQSDNSTTRDVYDVVAKTSREVSPMFGAIWSPIGHMGYVWPTRSVEPLPPFRLRKLRNQVLVIGNTADPGAPLVSAKFVVGLLADQAVLVEQLGFGHTSLAELSRCTQKIVTDYIMQGVLPQQNETKCKVDSLFGQMTSLFSLEDENAVPRFVVQSP